MSRFVKIIIPCAVAVILLLAINACKRCSMGAREEPELIFGLSQSINNNDTFRLYDISGGRFLGTMDTSLNSEVKYGMDMNDTEMNFLVTHSQGQDTLTLKYQFRSIYESGCGFMINAPDIEIKSKGTYRYSVGSEYDSKYWTGLRITAYY